MHIRSLILAAAILMIPGGSAQAGAWYGGEFSAKILMVNPQDPNSRAEGKLFVGKNKVRAEGSHAGVTKIVILDTQNHKAWTLLPDKKEYLEGVAGPVPPKPDLDPLPDDPNSLCNKGKGVTCQKTGVETIGQVQADKWELTVQGRDNQQSTMTLWSDPKRHLILRQITADGSQTERRQTGVETINGREAERWEFTMSSQGKSQTFTQWIDSKLRIPVRMTGQQGQFSSEINDIKEAPQGEELFVIPADFRRIEPPRGDRPAQPAR